MTMLFGFTHGFGNGTAMADSVVRTEDISAGEVTSNFMRDITSPLFTDLTFVDGGEFFGIAAVRAHRRGTPVRAEPLVVRGAEPLAVDALVELGDPGEARSCTATPSDAEGVTFNIESVEARYVRVHMLRNSANPGQHVVELEVLEAAE